MKVSIYVLIVLFTLFLQGWNAKQIPLQEVPSEIVADWSPVREEGKHPALIILGGSEGGNQYGHRWTSTLNDMGISVLSLTYFGKSGLPQHLERIPLEYFSSAIVWLKTQSGVDTAKIGIMGISKGAEAALLVASMHTDIHAVIAIAPSNMVWQSINPSNYMSRRSSFSLAGEDIPFVKYSFSKGFSNIYNFYAEALKKPLKPNVYIQAENINGPILLLSGGTDIIWPSQTMAQEIVKRLQEHKFPYHYQHFNYPDAGHCFHYTLTEVADSVAFSTQLPALLKNCGGTQNGFWRAQADAFLQTEEFLRHHLIK